MKKMKKFASVLLALVMALALAMPALAVSTPTDTNNYTITIRNAENNHSYKAYQIFKGTLDGEQITLSNVDWGSGVDGSALLAALQADETIGNYFEDCTTAADVANVLASDFENDSTDLDAFATIVNEHLTDVSSASGEATGPVDGMYNYAISVTGAGYYMVKDEDGSLASASGDAYTKFILQVVSNTTVVAKSDAPELEKKIVETDEDGEEELVDANNGAVGDTVTFQLKSRVPNMDGYDKYYFIVHDTLSAGLVYNENSITITVGDTILSDTDYELTVTGGEKDGDSTQIKIVFVDFYDNYKDNANDEIIIRYTATIDEDAVIGSTGNPNEAYLQYSNNPNVDLKGDNEPNEDEDDVTGTTPTDYTITYVTAIELTKVDGADNTKTLAGAQFEITGEKLNKVQTIGEVFVENEDGTWYKLTDGTYTETEPNDTTKGQYEGDGSTKYILTEESTWTTISTETVSATAYVDSNGVLRFSGLAEGTYTITELKAPDGYNLLTTPLTVVITCNVPDVVDTGKEEATWTYTINAGSEENATDGVITFDVENNSGSTLPETGGIGTTIFYVVGGVLVVGAAVLLITKKRMGSD